MYRSLTTVAAACWIAVFLFQPAGARAQQDTVDRAGILDLFEPDGSTELQLQGTALIALDDDNANNSGTAVVNYGWFFTERQQVGARAIVSVLDDDGSLDFAGTGGPFYRYNFLTGKVAPYVGASANFAFGEFSGLGSDVLLEVEGGSRFFLDRNLAFTVAGSVFYDVDQSELSDVLNVFFGFSYFWR